MNPTDKAIHEYMERLRSLLIDGYIVVHETQQVNFEFVRLRHRLNGKTIYLSRRDNIVQQSNEKRTLFTITYE